MTEYRIVKDRYLGYEVQARRLWFPFWVQCRDCGPTNTHSSLSEAEEFARNKANGEGRVVKYLGVIKRQSA